MSLKVDSVASVDLPWPVKKFENLEGKWLINSDNKETT